MSRDWRGGQPFLRSTYPKRFGSIEAQDGPPIWSRALLTLDITTSFIGTGASNEAHSNSRAGCGITVTSAEGTFQYEEHAVVFLYSCTSVFELRPKSHSCYFHRHYYKERNDR
ncbi:hypothetical protein EAH_00037670, partial [Eimeria acervulina]